VRVTFLGRSADIADIPITDDTDGPEAKALNARVEAICRYAREHVIDARAPDQPPELLRMPDERQVLTVGLLRCVYVHSITPKGRFRQLTIGVPGAPGVPPPEHCAVIAKMFGFTGMFVARAHRVRTLTRGLVEPHRVRDSVAGAGSHSAVQGDVHSSRDRRQRSVTNSGPARCLQHARPTAHR